jgi:c-di-GMP-binding flagellar brake protein YcgR
MFEPTIDRRSHERIKIAAIAIVWLEDRGPIRYFVEDLSAGGALLTGGPELPLGAKLGLTLHIDDEGLLEMDAEVVRKAQARPPVVGVAFRNVSPADEDIIQQTALRALEALSARSA